MNKNKKKTNINSKQDVDQYFTTESNEASSKKVKRKKKREMAIEPTEQVENDPQFNTDMNWYQEKNKEEDEPEEVKEYGSEEEKPKKKKKKSKKKKTEENVVETEEVVENEEQKEKPKKSVMNKKIGRETATNSWKKKTLEKQTNSQNEPPEEEEEIYEYCAGQSKTNKHEVNDEENEDDNIKETQHEYNDSQKKHQNEKKIKPKGNFGWQKKIAVTTENDDAPMENDENATGGVKNVEENDDNNEEVPKKKKKKKKKTTTNDDEENEYIVSMGKKIKKKKNDSDNEDNDFKLKKEKKVLKAADDSEEGKDEDKGREAWDQFDSGVEPNKGLKGKKGKIEDSDKKENEEANENEEEQQEIKKEKKKKKKKKSKKEINYEDEVEIPENKQKDSDNEVKYNIKQKGEEAEENNEIVPKKKKSKKKKTEYNDDQDQEQPPEIEPKPQEQEQLEDSPKVVYKKKSSKKKKRLYEEENEDRNQNPEQRTESEDITPKKKKKKKKNKNQDNNQDEENNDNQNDFLKNTSPQKEPEDNMENDDLGEQKRPTEEQEQEPEPEQNEDERFAGRKKMAEKIEKIEFEPEPAPDPEQRQFEEPPKENVDDNMNENSEDAKPKKKKKKKKSKNVDEGDANNDNTNENEGEGKPKKKKKKKKKTTTDEDGQGNDVEEVKPKKKKKKKKHAETEQEPEDQDQDQEQPPEQPEQPDDNNLFDSPLNPKQKRPKTKPQFDFDNPPEADNDQEENDFEFPPKTRKLKQEPAPQFDDDNNNYQPFENEDNDNNNNDNENDNNDNNDDNNDNNDNNFDFPPKNKPPQEFDQNEEQEGNDEYAIFESKMKKKKNFVPEDQQPEKNVDEEEEPEVEKKEEKGKKKKKKKKDKKKSKKSKHADEDEENNDEDGDDGNQLIVSKEEKKVFDIEPGLEIECAWYYINRKPKKKKKQDSDDDDSDDEKQSIDPDMEEKVHLEVKAKAIGSVILHWGIFKTMFGGTWFHPPKVAYPPNSKEIDKMAIQTPFPLAARLQQPRKIVMTIPRGTGLKDYIGGFKFVIFLPDKNVWFNNGGRDYVVQFNANMENMKSFQIKMKSGEVIPFFMLDVINCEANLTEWTLMHRYNKCAEIIQEWKNNVEMSKWIWIVIWIRYSFIRQLDWQRNYNTQPRLLSDAMNNLSNLLTKKYAEAIQKEKPYRNLIDSQTIVIKKLLAMLGKGTGNGQAIRDQILNIMHKNNIKECPTGNFYEQWHQKLHNNSTPDDVVICQGVIEFLKSGGDLELFWKILEEGGVTKKRLASYERKIIDEPYFDPNYCIQDFEDYLKTLKAVHASTDLIMTYEGCKQYIGDCTYLMDEIINNKDTDDIIKQLTRVAECREKLQTIMQGYLTESQTLREILFLELSLEVYVRQLVEKAIHIDRDIGDLLWEIQLILRNIRISYPNYTEFAFCCEDWYNILEKLIRDQSRDASLKVYSALSRMNRLLSFVIDYYTRFYDEKAKYFGDECKLDKEAVALFSEEMIRGTIFFTLSMLIKKLEPNIRRNAQLGDWMIISRGKEPVNYGKVMHVPNLREEQFAKYKEPRIIACENVSGDEEVPVGCTALLIIKSGSYPDTLSHISVRARNLGIPFAVCFNDEKSNMILRYLNNYAEVKIVGQEVLVSPSSGQSSKKIKTEKVGKINLVNSGNTYKKIFVELNEMDNNCVGAKSLNTKNVFGRVSGCGWLKYPESFAIPFNVFEYFLSFPENEQINLKIQKYLSKIETANKKEKIKKLLNKCKQETMKINFVENKETSLLKRRILQFGVRPNDFMAAFTAIKSVWASKFNERAYIAVSKVGVKINQIKMSVLCQKIIPAEYAYVIHTKNPTNNSEDELFAEVVAGMGETLVGAYEGQSLSFSYNKRNGNYTILSYPNKNISLRNSGFIFRSDSNIEDLEGFSGAGLFDSVPMVQDQIVDMVYYKEKLVMDGGFIDNMIKKISQLGIAVEQMYRSPQDIEGVYYNGDFYIVQTRPQV